LPIDRHSIWLRPRSRHPLRRSAWGVGKPSVPSIGDQGIPIRVSGCSSNWGRGFGCVVNLQLLDQPPGPSGPERFVQRRDLLSVEIVCTADLLGVGVLTSTRFRIALRSPPPVRRSVTITCLRPPRGSNIMNRLAVRAFVFVMFGGRAARRGGDRYSRFLSQLLARFVRTYHGAFRVVVAGGNSSTSSIAQTNRHLDRGVPIDAFSRASARFF